MSSFNWKGRALNQVLRLRSVPKGVRRFPVYVRPVAGWQWWNLSEPAVEHILGFLDEHPDYRTYHGYTWCPDELFFHSILLGTDFAQRFEVVNDDLRFKRWSEGESHPDVLAEEDLPAILASGKPFGRKFDAEIDSVVLSGLGDHVNT